MSGRDPLQQSMVNDFHKIISNNLKLEELFDTLPESERLVVENAYLEWAWQCVLAGATAHSETPPEQEAPEFIRAFGGFVLSCQAGKHAVFKTGDWVALDRASYEEAVELAKQVREGIAQVKKDQQ